MYNSKFIELLKWKFNFMLNPTRVELNLVTVKVLKWLSEVVLRLSWGYGIINVTPGILKQTSYTLNSKS